MIEPVSGFRSGAPGGATSRAMKTSTTIRPQNENRRPRVSAADISALSTGSSPLYVPSRGSTIRSVISATTRPITSTEAAENQRFAVSEMVLFGSTMWIASLVMPVRMPSTGTMKTFTRNTDATAAKPAASPASGWRPTLMKAAAARGISTR